MGRPSKLTDAQWDEVQRRILAGEKAADLAKEYRVNKSAISRRVAQPSEKVKAVVNQVLAAESALKSLPVAQRSMAVDLLDELRQLSMSAAIVARIGMQNAHRLAGIAQGIVEKVDDADPALKSPVQLKTIEWLGELVKSQAHVGINLLSANKERIRQADETDNKTGQRTVRIIDGPDA